VLGIDIVESARDAALRDRPFGMDGVVWRLRCA
jgi:hypothetical protein